jgi:hypothetical protein
MVVAVVVLDQELVQLMALLAEVQVVEVTTVPVQLHHHQAAKAMLVDLHQQVHHIIQPAVEVELVQLVLTQQIQ